MWVDRLRWPSLPGAWGPKRLVGGYPSLRAHIGPLELGSPIGLAAGFEKDGRRLWKLVNAGFGFMEIGSVTAEPERGRRDKQVVFPIPMHGSIVNRVGLRNPGIEAVVGELGESLPISIDQYPVVIGINMALNHRNGLALRDFPVIASRVSGVCARTFGSYLCVNVSCPNAEPFWDLRRLPTILRAIRAASQDAARPVLVKIAPDLKDDALRRVVEYVEEGGGDGLVVGNSINGLSGRPIHEVAVRGVARAWKACGGRLAVVGCGGVEDGAGAWRMVRAGASAVQLLTAFMYRGPAVVERVERELATLVAEAGMGSVREAVGVDCDKVLEDMSSA